MRGGDAFCFVGRRTQASDYRAAFRQVAIDQLGLAAVVDAGLHFDRGGFAVGAEYPEFAAAGTARAFAFAATPCRRRRLFFTGSARRTKAQRRIRNLQHRVLLRRDDAHVGGHARQQDQVGVGGRDDHGVADDIRNHLRGLAHLHDAALEALAGEGVDGERGLLADL